MSRVPDLSAGERTPEQSRIYEEIAGPRGGVVRGPFAIWLRNPELADKANQLGNVLRIKGLLDKRLFELAILVVARSWTAQYEWYAHAQAALAAGLDAAIVDSLREGREPVFSRADERLVYKVSRELQTQRALGDATYREAEALLGLPLLIELISVVGFYTMVAIVLVGFDAPVPGGSTPLTGLGFPADTAPQHKAV